MSAVDEVSESGGEGPRPGTDRMGRIARLVSAFGREAAERLGDARVAVVGAGGTGSPAIEVLARAGVGHIISVDPDLFTESNLERVHGSTNGDVAEAPAKVALARRHIESINPLCRVTAIRGRVPQPEVVDEVVHADVVLGCTDQHHSRLALSDLATRYLVPFIDCGVGLEGGGGRVTAQVLQLVRFLPADPCVLCRRMTLAWRVTQELMTSEDRQTRQAAALEARERGEAGDAYWHDEVQLNTVGYLTTVAGALAAAYAIGWITNRFDPPFSRLQMNISASFFDVTDVDESPREDCPCRRVRGWADQGAVDALITAPLHWPAPVQLARAPWPEEGSSSRSTLSMDAIKSGEMG